MGEGNERKNAGLKGGRMKTWSDCYSLSHFYCLSLSLSLLLFLGTKRAATSKRDGKGWVDGGVCMDREGKA